MLVECVPFWLSKKVPRRWFCEVLQEIYVKGDDTVSGLKSFNTLDFATILCDKFILAGEFVKGMIMKDDLRLGSH